MNAILRSHLVSTSRAVIDEIFHDNFYLVVKVDEVIHKDKHAPHLVTCNTTCY